MQISQITWFKFKKKKEQIERETEREREGKKNIKEDKKMCGYSAYYDITFKAYFMSYYLYDYIITNNQIPSRKKVFIIYDY